jgi:hypothetical protein
LVGIQIVKRFLRRLFRGTIISFSAWQTSLDDDVVLFKVGLVCAYLHMLLVSYYHFYFCFAACCIGHCIVRPPAAAMIRWCHFEICYHCNYLFLEIKICVPNMCTYLDISEDSYFQFYLPL